jgi:hypothetical protein
MKSLDKGARCEHSGNGQSTTDKVIHRMSQVRRLCSNHGLSRTDLALAVELTLFTTRLPFL